MTAVLLLPPFLVVSFELLARALAFTLSSFPLIGIYGVKGAESFPV